LELEGLRALIVDDNDTNRLILREFLSSLAGRVVAVGSGPEALTELYRAKEESQPFDIVLLDGRMPEMDGFSVAKKIRSDPGLGGTPLLMLTSDNRVGDTERARSMGIQRCLVKPVKRRELQNAIRTAHFQDSATKAMDRKKPAGSKTAPLTGKRILLVDDSADNRLLAKTFLHKAGHTVVEAENGQEALDRFVAEAYDLVLMDVQMPVMDGYAATEAIRNWEEGSGRARTPIVALTAHAYEEDHAKSLAAGCDGHLSKPVNKSKLLETVAELMGDPS
jgi:CheY-like chemotaxis protein